MMAIMSPQTHPTPHEARHIDLEQKVTFEYLFQLFVRLPLFAIYIDRLAQCCPDSRSSFMMRFAKLIVCYEDWCANLILTRLAFGMRRDGADVPNSNGVLASMP